MAVREMIEGKTLEEAIAAAAARLNVPAEDVHYRLLDEGRRGILGVGARNVRIEIELPEGATPRPVPPPPPPPPVAAAPPDEVDEPEPAADPAIPPAERVAEVVSTVERIVSLAGLDLSVRATAVPGGVDLDLNGADRKLVAQRGGELAQALQFLLNRMGRRTWPEVGRITIAGAHGGGNRRDDELVEEIREVAGQVARTGKAKRLQPMNPYERRLVHVTVREFAGLETHSEGQGFLKAVTIRRTGS